MLEADNAQLCRIVFWVRYLFIVHLLSELHEGVWLFYLFN
jgi:hypothetical protein